MELYDSYMKYYKSLCAYGAVSYEAVYKLLAKQFIYDIMNSCLINPNDVIHFNKAMMCIDGTSCLTPIEDNKAHSTLGFSCKGL